MKRNSIIFILTILLLITYLITACGGNDSKQNNLIIPTPPVATYQVTLLPPPLTAIPLPTSTLTSDGHGVAPDATAIPDVPFHQELYTVTQDDINAQYTIADIMNNYIASHPDMNRITFDNLNQLIDPDVALQAGQMITINIPN